MAARYVRSYSEGLYGGPAKTWWLGHGGKAGTAAQRFQAY
jgi:hypothetical protein